ncbi:MAG: ABC transporter permease subunit [Singulisphaera sp.]|nr:ABC transporter permease subunit [Singulisphaera sp.]
MEETADASGGPHPLARIPRLLSLPVLRDPRLTLVALSFIACCLLEPRPSRADTLAEIRARGRLIYGGDMEGGGPYVYPDPNDPREVAGFEVELMDALGRELGVKAEFSQGPWDRLLEVLRAGRIDLVINGYEWTEARARDFLATRPYYTYQLQLMARRDGPIGSWQDLGASKPGGGSWRVGVLNSSAADTFADESGGPHVEVVRFDGGTDAMRAVENGQIDATLQDLPTVLFYRGRYPTLKLAGPPVGKGDYVIYVRRGDEPLRDALDRGLGRLIDSGELRWIYERHGLWNDAQRALSDGTGAKSQASRMPRPEGLELLWRYRSRLLAAAWVTIVLSVTSMPLAMALGLLIALGRMYGPRPLRRLLAAYVELLRGTPLMLQLFVLFYLLKLPVWVAGIGGLAINYSAYEAEIYRAGLQAIPAGQMEAALALGMSRQLALRRVIVPQAVRIVIPPVTNDFIALFKDTSVCSVITLVELTKQYSILGNSTGGWLEFALATSLLYLAMSLPLSWFSRWSERRWEASGAKGGAPA